MKGLVVHPLPTPMNLPSPLQNSSWTCYENKCFYQHWNIHQEQKNPRPEVTLHLMASIFMSDYEDQIWIPAISSRCTLIVLITVSVLQHTHWRLLSRCCQHWAALTFFAHSSIRCIWKLINSSRVWDHTDNSKVNVPCEPHLASRHHDMSGQPQSRFPDSQVKGRS